MPENCRCERLNLNTYFEVTILTSTTQERGRRHQSWSPAFLWRLQCGSLSPYLVWCKSRPICSEAHPRVDRSEDFAAEPLSTLGLICFPDRFKIIAPSLTKSAKCCAPEDWLSNWSMTSAFMTNTTGQFRHQQPLWNRHGFLAG